MFGKVCGSIKVISAFSVLLCGVCMSADSVDSYLSGIKNIDGARSFQVFTRDHTISDEQITKIIDATVRGFSGGRLDECVAILCKLDSLCGDTFAKLRKIASDKIELLVGSIDTTKRDFDVRLANVLWNSLLSPEGRLKSTLEWCVIEKIGILLKRRIDEPAKSLMSVITETLKKGGHEQDIATYF